MFSFGWRPIHIFPIIFLVSSAIFPFTYGVPRQHRFRTHEQFGGVIMMRHVLEETKGNEVTQNGSLVLAAKRTYRKDPLDDYKYYNGGWDIANQHYLFSVTYTAFPFVVIAILWFVAMGMYLCCSCLCCYCCCCCCCGLSTFGYSRIVYTLSFISIVIFTISAVIGCGVLYSGQHLFYDSVEDTMEYLVEQAKKILDNFQGLWDALQSAKNIKVGDSSMLPEDLVESIDQVNSIVSQISELTDRNSTKSTYIIEHIFQPARLVVNVSSIMLLILLSLGFLFSTLGLKCVVYILVIIGWIVVTITFILCGVFLVFHNSVADTCVAMNEWVQNPVADSAMSQILPCVDTKVAQEAVNTTKLVTFQMNNFTNTYITNVTNKNLTPDDGPLYYNQSGPLLPMLCNSLDSSPNKVKCRHGEVTLDNATVVWKKYVCEVSEDGICSTEGRLTPNSYEQLAASANVSYGLTNYEPFLVSLLDCSFTRDTFEDIGEEQCPGLRQTSKCIYVGLVTVSISLMFSLIFWMSYARERRHRLFTRDYFSVH